jgi:hypothetical protein
MKNSEQIQSANVEILNLKKEILLDVGVKNDKID